ncbi:E3 ubiquitin/ISG15 ligase TRIM25-like [Dendropsophus ebraccatus]|uniref:E3 ubiquitin/ISG15 ligase TRIM25-like n=1 Tax=Dendropsophus ebraccatus TaxID=150705 RepID=UPI0038313ADE
MASGDLRDELICGICLNLYRRPVTLRCGHSFCWGCIERALDSQEKSAVYTCPSCRKRFSTRPVLQKNVALSGISERCLFPPREKRRRLSFCSYCLQAPVPAVRHCLLCEASLCDDHLRVHSKSPEHALCEPSPFKRLHACPSHRQQLEYYCPQEATCLCSTCAEEHRGHQLEPLPEAAKKKKEKLRKLLEKLSSEHRAIREKILGLRRQEEALDYDAKAASSRIVSLLQDLRQQMDDLEKHIKEEINSKKQQVSTALTKSVEHLEGQSKELSKKMFLIRDLRATKDPVTVLTHWKMDSEDLSDIGDFKRDSDDSSSDTDDSELESEDSVQGAGESVQNTGESSQGAGESAQDTGESRQGAGESAQDTGESRQGAGESAQDTGESRQGAGESAQDTGESRQGAGESAQDTGESRQGAGESAQDTGESRQGAGESAQDTGESRQGAGESAQDTGESRQGAGESAQDSGESRQGAGESAQDSGESMQGVSESAQYSGESRQGAVDSAQDTGENRQGAGESAQDSGESIQGVSESAQDTEDNWQGVWVTMQNAEGNVQDTGEFEEDPERWAQSFRRKRINSSERSEDTRVHRRGADESAQSTANSEQGAEQSAEDNEQLYVEGSLHGDISEIIYCSLSDMLLRVSSWFSLGAAAKILLDRDTASNNISLSLHMKFAFCTEKDQNRPPAPGRFQSHQVLSYISFTSGRHYWDVGIGGYGSWKVGVCYPSIERSGDRSYIGNNDRSWCLCDMSGDQISVMHNGEQIHLPMKIRPNTIRVWLDYEAGRLAFYDLGEEDRHLYTFSTTFTEPLYAAFYVGAGWDSRNYLNISNRRW